MISRVELGYITQWPKNVPYPGTKYCEETFDKLAESVEIFKEKYLNNKYNIIFSDSGEIQLEIKDKNLCHMLGIDYKNLKNEYFSNFREKVLGIRRDETISSYDLLQLILEKKNKVIEYDKNNSLRAINYYKLSIKQDIFQKLYDLNKFGFGCINFDKNIFAKKYPEMNFKSNATKLLYVESDESISPYFFIGLKDELNTVWNKDADNDFFELTESQGSNIKNHIVETLIASENFYKFFDGQEVVIPTQILLDLNNVLNKTTASSEQKIKLLKDYKALIQKYDLQNLLNTDGDYYSMLMEKKHERILKNEGAKHEF